MSAAVSFVLQKDLERLSGASIKNAIKTHFPQLELSFESPQDENDNVVAFNIGDAIVGIASVRAPFPWADLEGPCATSYLWPKAAEEIAGHKSHLIISLTGNFSPIEGATLLTQITAAYMLQSPVALGVYWGPATLLIPKEIFNEFALTILPQGPPLDIWVDFRVGWAEDIISSGFTVGLEALGHMEFEVVKSPENPSDLRERLQNLAYYVIEHGNVINDNDTVGDSHNEHIKVVYSDSAFGAKNKVMLLDYGAATKRKWWKVGK